MARNGNGLAFRDSASALRATIELPRTADGDDALELLDRDVLRGFSVEFRCLREDWAGNVRVVREATLTGLALVANPAYVGAVTEELRARTHASRQPENDLWPLL